MQTPCKYRLVWLYLVAYLLLGFLPINLQAQSGIKDWMARRSAHKDSVVAQGKPFLSPMLGPGYTPENGLLIGGGLLYTFKTNRDDTLIQRSSLPAMGFISTNGNVGLNSNISTFWWQDKFRLMARIKLANGRDDYFGVGFAKSEQISQSDTTSKYLRTQWRARPEALFRVFPNFFAGVIVDFNKTNVKEVNPLMALDQDYRTFGPENYNAGVGFSLGYDSRDFTKNAWSGWYAYSSGAFYGDYLGSNNHYQIYEIDLRTYHQIHREGNVIAVKLYTRFGFGDVPYEELTRIGGGDALRGYLSGKYRDKAGVYLLTEWRHMFLKTSGDMSNHGIAVWLGSGSIANELSQVTEWVPNLGVGYRWQVQPRMNLRIDFGIGRESSGLYFNFGEAF